MVPQLSSNYYSAKTSQAGWANEQSMYSIMSMSLTKVAKVSNTTVISYLGHCGLGRFVEQKLMLSSSFRCYRILICRRYDFGHTLLCNLSQT